MTPDNLGQNRRGTAVQINRHLEPVRNERAAGLRTGLDGRADRDVDGRGDAEIPVDRDLEADLVGALVVRRRHAHGELQRLDALKLRLRLATQRLSRLLESARGEIGDVLVRRFLIAILATACSIAHFWISLMNQ